MPDPYVSFLAFIFFILLYPVNYVTMKSGEIVLNMHKKGYSLDQIVEITNLDVSTVKAIIG